jgi:hypothetical protein
VRHAPILHQRRVRWAYALIGDMLTTWGPWLLLGFTSLDATEIAPIEGFGAPVRVRESALMVTNDNDRTKAGG